MKNTDNEIVYFLKLQGADAEVARRRISPKAYCDRQGNVHTPDYAVVGKQNLQAVKGLDAEIIATFPNAGELIAFGPVDTALRHKDEGLRIIEEMRGRRMSIEDRVNVSRAYQNFRGEPLPPLPIKKAKTINPAPEPQGG